MGRSLHRLDNRASSDEKRNEHQRLVWLLSMSMTGKSVCSYSFLCCAQTITMASKSLLTIGDESVQVDPQLLFQRLILACNSAEELTSVFQYELASYPTALFESPLMMNPVQKPGLADVIWSTLSPDAKTGPTTQVHYVLDGGAYPGLVVMVHIEMFWQRIHHM